MDKNYDRNAQTTEYPVLTGPTVRDNADRPPLSLPSAIRHILREILLDTLLNTLRNALRETLLDNFLDILLDILLDNLLDNLLDIFRVTLRDKQVSFLSPRNLRIKIQPKSRLPLQPTLPHTLITAHNQPRKPHRPIP